MHQLVKSLDDGMIVEYLKNSRIFKKMDFYVSRCH